MTAQNNGKLYDIFITHAWRYHEDWTRMGEIFDSLPGFKWRNFSVPWHDPAINANTEAGGRLVREWLENQIIPARCMIFLSGVYEVKSCRKWLDFELETARRLKKPILGVPPLGATSMTQELCSLCDSVVSGWNAPEIVQAMDKLMEPS